MCNAYDDNDRHRARPAPLIRQDLCAQLAPLNSYGLVDFSASLVDGLMALGRASKTAVRALRPAAQADGACA